MSGSKSASQAALAGPAHNNSSGDLFNAITFMMDQHAAKKSHAVLVKVVAVHGGGASSVPTVDCQPMVDQVDGYGNRTAHGIIYGIPAHRAQSGSTAIIQDPIVGDVGHLIISDRDISTVKATGQISGPGSSRQNSKADGLFYNGFSSLSQGPAPTTFVEITPDGGVKITTPNAIALKATGNLTIDAANATLDTSGNLKVTGNITAGNGGGDQVTLQQHRHTGVQVGAGTTQVPIPGS